jgi:hypothetical protein
VPGFDWLDPDPRKTARERKRRNVATAVLLGALVVLFYVMTVIRVHP